MGTQNSQFFAIVLSLLCSGICMQESGGENYSLSRYSYHKKLTAKEQKTYRSTRLDVTAPLTTVPIINPTPRMSKPSDPTTSVEEPNMNPVIEAPYSSTNTAMGTPTVSSGLSWCIASETASQAALQVALDYACGYGADCLEIQTGNNCYEPNTVRDHASYAFNSYYQKNPVPTSCNFGGTAVLTSINPSMPNCQYSSTSITSSLLNTSSVWGSTVFGTVPPNTSNSALKSVNFLLFIQTCTLTTVFTVIMPDTELMPLFLT